MKKIDESGRREKKGEREKGSGRKGKEKGRGNNLIKRGKGRDKGDKLGNDNISIFVFLVIYIK